MLPCDLNFPSVSLPVKDTTNRPFWQLLTIAFAAVSPTCFLAFV